LDFSTPRQRFPFPDLSHACHSSDRSAPLKYWPSFQKLTLAGRPSMLSMARHGCCVFPMVDIENEISEERTWKQFALSVFDLQHLGPRLSLFEVIHEFYCLETLICWDSDSLQSNSSIFPIATAFCFSFPLLLHIALIFQIKSNYYLKKEMLMRLFC
jgi:hypothetical protein